VRRDAELDAAGGGRGRDGQRDAGRPVVVPRAEAALCTGALVPQDDAALRGLVGSGPAKEVEDAGPTVRQTWTSTVP
jgi:hypothetical protein